MRYLPPQFTWKDYLAWSAEVVPDARFSEAVTVFDLFFRRFIIVPAYIENGELTYRLR